MRKYISSDVCTTVAASRSALDGYLITLVQFFPFGDLETGGGGGLSLYESRGEFFVHPPVLSNPTYDSQR